MDQLLNEQEAHFSNVMSIFKTGKSINIIHSSKNVSGRNPLDPWIMKKTFDEMQ